MTANERNYGGTLLNLSPMNVTIVSQSGHTCICTCSTRKHSKAPRDECR